MSIINDQELKIDFIEGLCNYLGRSLTKEELDEYVSDKIMEICLDDMYQAESDLIILTAQQIEEGV